MINRGTEVEPDTVDRVEIKPTEPSKAEAVLIGDGW